ncbi:MAG: endonuclease III [Puniceicoccaceae bacterium 5H]|nr:MAG: endonuclease III [Puniceicoccaceae bacterium 5H]
MTVSGRLFAMNKKERAAIVYQQLQDFCPKPIIPLRYYDAYSLLVAVLLSAQCTDERVNQVTPRLWELARTPQEMMKIPEEKILEIVRPCGLGPRKAKAIKELSRILSEEYGGEVPQEEAQLEALPGVGHKTAEVVRAQAFDIPAFPVDTHIHRLAQRFGLTSGKNVVQTEKDLKALYPPETWGHLHLQFIYYGRQHCTARKKCDGSTDACPLCPIVNAGRKTPRKTKKA